MKSYNTITLHTDYSDHIVTITRNNNVSRTVHPQPRDFLMLYIITQGSKTQMILEINIFMLINLQLIPSTFSMSF